MSFWSKATSFGSAALKATTEAATAAAKVTTEVASAAHKATSEAIEDLKAPPTTVKCSGCQAILAVPPEVFTWICQTPSCLSQGLTYPLSTMECAECKQPQPTQPPPEIACGVCSAHTLVPTTKAAAHLATAKDTTVKVTSQVVAYASKTVDTLRSAPTHVACPQCKADLDVPADVFNWDCSACKITMTSPDMKEGETRRILPPNKCTGCGAAAPESSPSVTCEACKISVPVPRSNASKYLSTASTATKEAAVKSGEYLNAQYKTMSAAPVEFNCEHCNTVLRAEGVDPEDFKNDIMLTCGACQKATTVPKSNFMNMLRSSAAKTSRGVGKVYYTVSKTPFVVCTTCQTSVPLPVVEGEKAPDEEDDVPKREPITCPKCATELQPMAQPLHFDEETASTDNI